MNKELCSEYCICKEACAIGYSLHGCEHFKDKRCFIEMPCPMGTELYMIVTKRPKIGFPEFSFIKETKLTFNNAERVKAEFGTTYFKTFEEAKEELQRREQ